MVKVSKIDKDKVKKPLILMGLSLISMVIHNLIYGLTKFEEPCFFLLTFIFAIGAIISFLVGLFNK